MSYEPGKFRYCDYWRHWSLIVAVDDCYVTEIDVTPINPTWHSSWVGITVYAERNHCTPADKRDRFVDELPKEAVELVYKMLSPECAERHLKFIKARQKQIMLAPIAG